MKKHSLFLLSVIFLVSCNLLSPEAQATATAAIDRLDVPRIK